MVFFDHSLPEGEDKKIKQANENGLSKVNLGEIDLIVKIVKYLLQQNYKETQLVVLTPYLGQLLKIKKAMQKEKQAVELSKKDRKELTQAGAAVEETPPAVNAVRVATIDNYQGEEADVVVVSLVRSNNTGIIGFLRDAERVNVMLSRARHGMILLGNSTTLLNAKDQGGRTLWTKLIEMFKAKGQFFQGFPIYCQQHPTATRLVNTPQMFEQMTPEGGCNLDCNMPLPCGLHSCIKKCHSVDHSKFVCKAEETGLCSKGHVLHFTCDKRNDPSSKYCIQCSNLLQKEEEAKKLAEKKAKEEQEQRAADEIKMKEASAQLETARRELQAVEDHKERSIHIEKLRIEKETTEKLLEMKKSTLKQDIDEKKAAVKKEAEDQLKVYISLD